VIARLADPAAAEAWCARARAAGRSIGFVPTMGALHAGHLTLIAAARAQCDAVCASVFVNPLQFDDPRDFERYPRDLEGDSALLDGAGCAMVFSGTLEQFFPESGGRRESIAWRDPGPSALGLEGEHRPGHFAGVATIVARLFEVVRPAVAFFGAKDFQQTLVVRDLARAMGGPRIAVCPTAREPSGLAMSSRNQRLSAAQRSDAAAIYRALTAGRRAWEEGLRAADELAQRVARELERAPLELEYAAVRDPERWTAGDPPGQLERAIALVAARCGPVRLIDNLRLDRAEP
jgi:pantoate--beta-alanine ligase